MGFLVKCILLSKSSAAGESTRSMCSAAFNEMENAGRGGGERPRKLQQRCMLLKRDSMRSLQSRRKHAPLPWHKTATGCFRCFFKLKHIAFVMLLYQIESSDMLGWIVLYRMHMFYLLLTLTCKGYVTVVMLTSFSLSLSLCSFTSQATQTNVCH